MCKKYYMTFNTPREAAIRPWTRCKATTLADAKKESDSRLKGYGVMFYIGVLNVRTGRVNIAAKKRDSTGEWLDFGPQGVNNAKETVLP